MITLYFEFFPQAGWYFMRQTDRSAWLRYGAALIFTGAALILKLVLVPLVTHDEPVLIFFAAVIVSAAFGGLGPGLLTTVLGALFDGYFFMAPFDRFELNSADEVLRLAIFVAEGAFISLICARMKAARHQAEESAAETQELEGRLLQISEAEQRRIGHDLHDGLSQHLTGIGLLARRLEEKLSTTAPASVADAAQLCTLAKTAVELTRDMCRSLSPSTLESAGLDEALRQLVGHAENIFHIACTFDQAGPPVTLALAPSVHLYRIAQEAINNAVRHAQASHVWLRLDTRSPWITLLVIDDGIGIQSPSEASSGLGLRIMRYRARRIGASLEVKKRDAGGTAVICRYNPSGIPLGSERLWTMQDSLYQPKGRGSSWSKTTQSFARD